MSAASVPTTLATGVVVALGLAAALAGLVAWCGPIDPPRTRGAHRRLTPTSGGLAILAAASVGAAVGVARLPVLYGAPGGQVTAALAVACGLGLLGAADDLLDFGARPKLMLQMLTALVFAVSVARIEALPLAPGITLPLGPWLGAVGAALWIVVATNAVNFMDGADGLAAGALSIALAALAAGAWRAGEPGVAAAAAAGAAANLGFLPWNLGGRLFQGDAGALFSGFLLSALAVVAERRGTGLYVYFVPLTMLPFLTDVLLTLLLRARRGESLLEAHRDHLYQLWLRRTGRSHLALAWRVAMIMAAFAAAALAAQQAAVGARPILFACALVVCVGGWATIRRRLERDESRADRDGSHSGSG